MTLAIILALIAASPVICSAAIVVVTGWRYAIRWVDAA